MHASHPKFTMVLIPWLLDIQLPMQLVPDFESRTGEAYLLQHYVIRFVNDLWQISSFLRTLRFPPPKN